MKFDEFPRGPYLWLVKWIDQYRLGHAASRSPSITICLQQIETTTRRHIGRLRPSEIGELFSRRYGQDTNYSLARILTGYLPFLRIGQIYSDGELVGALPSEDLNLAVLRGDESGRSIKLGERLAPPKGWTKPFRLLNPSQYDVPNTFFESECWTVKHDHGADIVIPRTLIEQTFYYPHSEIANAYSAGPWEHCRQNLIFFGALESGLKTQIAPDTGEWQIILETKVKDDFAPLLALLNFDPYAFRCANSIYACALQERRSWYDPWHASGRIPFNPAAGPVKLILRGNWLRSIRLKGSETFLATHIAGYSFPASIPSIAWGRRNSGKGSDNPIPSSAPPPFRGATSTTRGSAERRVFSSHDATTERGTEEFKGPEIKLISDHPIRELKKSSHKTYAGTHGNLEDENTERTGSAGANTQQQGAHSKVQIENPVLPPSAQFSALIGALTELRNEGLVRWFSVFDPGSEALRLQRGGLHCWHFLARNALELRQGRLPRRGWFIRNPGEWSPTLRAALVLEIEVAGRMIHWIEIERRTTESGMGSPVFIDVPEALAHQFVEETLPLIALSRGSGLRRVAHDIASFFDHSITADLFQHAYQRETQDGNKNVVGFNNSSIERFLKRASTRPPK